MKEISKYIPENGFLRDYVQYASQVTDAPAIYHLFNGLIVLATILGNNAYIPFGPLRIYPNLYVLLLGPAAFFRKTYSISIARLIIEKVDKELLLPDEFSLEKLIEKLGENPVGLLFWPEFGNTLQYFERSYMLGAKEFITDLFDCRPSYVRELKSTKYVIERPSVSIAAASTPAWLISRVRGDDIRGGFYSRFIYVTAKTKTKRMSIPPEPNKQLENKLIIQANQYTKLSGSFDISEIKDIYQDWLFDHEDEALGKDNQEILSGFYSRLGIYALKFAMLYQVSTSRDFSITTESMLRAIHLVKLLKTNLSELLEYDLVSDKNMREKAKVLRLIAREPGIKRSKLLTHANMLKNTLNEILDTLKQEEKIRQHFKGKAVCYYPTQHKEDSRRHIVEIVKETAES
jgi:hypothetical protein